MPSNYVHRFNENRKIKRPFAAVSSQIRQYVENPEPVGEMLDKLEEIGMKAIRSAAEKKGRDPRYPGNITTNQYEAYAYIVFFNGKRMRSGTTSDDGVSFRKGMTIHHDPDRDPKRNKSGREEARSAIGHFKAPGNKGYTLVLLNAMWYSAIHERGWRTSNGWHQFNVITIETKEAYARIMELLGKYSDKVTASVRTVNTKINV